MVTATSKLVSYPLLCESVHCIIEFKRNVVTWVQEHSRPLKWCCRWQFFCKLFLRKTLQDRVIILIHNHALTEGDKTNETGQPCGVNGQCSNGWNCARTS
ncbi:hypothetical protein KC19_8G147400 [Ceratodon purpureus]|uniref:Uncharacterized protein n=1 Tax=Ceratodon purpureus TaxID=3225 RepID=A0A8T0H732_CERPU|nr:hypothetical protein KC19_8G147400 [Ceratodon purpureus]